LGLIPAIAHFGFTRTVLGHVCEANEALITSILALSPGDRVLMEVEIGI
jgi:hypothetical protein